MIARPRSDLARQTLPVGLYPSGPTNQALSIKKAFNLLPSGSRK